MLSENCSSINTVEAVAGAYLQALSLAFLPSSLLVCTAQAAVSLMVPL